MGRGYAISPRDALKKVNAFIAKIGAPALAVTNYFVVSTSMKVGAYTLAHTASPDGLPRNVTVATTAVSTADTQGTIVVNGTDTEGSAITEILTPISGTPVAGNKVFKTITSIAGVGWVVNTGADSIVVGFGTKVGLPQSFISIGDVNLVPLTGQLGTAVVGLGAANSGVGDDEEECWVDLSASTYDGTKILYVTGAHVLS